MPRTEEFPSDRVLADLRRRIGVGEWDHGEALPAVARLADEYGVSRGAVSRALRLLASEGLIRVIPRWESFRV
jgi:DNA-binding GntR family transcriptional regulator